MFYELFARDGYEKDVDGIVWYELGGSYYYHPIYVLRAALFELENYQTSGNRIHLSRATMFLDKLVEESEEIDEHPYLAYRFDTRISVGVGEVHDLRQPWFSGMAQGVGASVASRIFAHTGDEYYLALARALARTVTTQHPERPALSHVDSDGYYWIDEYPYDPPTLVLNGFIVAVFGLHDLVLAGGGSDIRLHRDRAIETLKRYSEEYRVPGDLSFYSIRTRQQHEWYHLFHIRLFEGLYSITDDPFFKDLAEDLEADYEVYKGH